MKGGELLPPHPPTPRPPRTSRHVLPAEPPPPISILLDGAVLAASGKRGRPGGRQVLGRGAQAPRLGPGIPKAKGSPPLHCWEVPGRCAPLLLGGLSYLPLFPGAPPPKPRLRSAGRCALSALRRAPPTHVPRRKERKGRLPPSARAPPAPPRACARAPGPALPPAPPDPRARRRRGRARGRGRRGLGGGQARPSWVRSGGGSPAAASAEETKPRPEPRGVGVGPGLRGAPAADPAPSRRRRLATGPPPPGRPRSGLPSPAPRPPGASAGLRAAVGHPLRCGSGPT